MKLQPDKATDHNTISAVGRGYLDVNAKRFTQSVLLLPDTAAEHWLVQTPQSIDGAALEAVLRAAPELLVIGTGTKQHFIHPKHLGALYAARIGVEMMNTAAACRTYNILAGEGRKVAAALIVEAD